MRLRRVVLILCFLGPIVACASARPRPELRDFFVQEGVASYYGSGHHGRRTASGETFDERRLTAAHRTLPFGTRVRVTNLDNGRQVIVVVTDRGPFRKERVIDVTSRAARDLGFLRAGTARVRVEEVPE